MNTIPEFAENVQILPIRSPKGTKAHSRPVRSRGQFRAGDCYWNRPMNKDEKTFITERNRWGSLRSEKSLTAGQLKYVYRQVELWQELVILASATADADQPLANDRTGGENVTLAAEPDTKPQGKPEPKKEQWWFNLKLGMAGDTRFIIARKGEITQTFENHQFEYNVEIITSDGRKYSSTSKEFTNRRRELAAQRGM